MNVEPIASVPTVTGAIRHAARATGTDFKYLLATARVESNFNADAQARTSSARGMFQFIEQTRLASLKEMGGALGYAPYMTTRSRAIRPASTRSAIRACTAASWTCAPIPTPARKAR